MSAHALSRTSDTEKSSLSLLTPQNISLAILHEDADLLAIHKPAGVSVQYSHGCIEHAVVFYLNATCGGTFGTPKWPWKRSDSFEGLVHRLDKGTSGILLLAKHPQAAQTLKLAFEERRVHKTYLAIADGYPKVAEQNQAAVDCKTVKDHTLSTSSIPPALVPEEVEPTAEQKKWSKVIKNCGRNHTLALQLLKATPNPSASCYSAAISVCRRAGERDLALGVLESLVPPAPSHVRPNLLSFKTCLSLCALDPPLCDTALELVLEKMPACGFDLHPHCVSSAIAACGRNGRLEDALHLLTLIETQEGQLVDSCRQAAIKACQRCGDLQQAHKLSTESQVMQSQEPNCTVPLLNLGSPITVVAPIGKIGPRRMGIVDISEGGRRAKSIVVPVAYSQSSSQSYHRVVIETGRTHQIRVHMADALGCPLVGDTVYGPNSGQKHRPMLHAAELCVPHPTTGDILQLSCRPPSDFEELAMHIMDKEAYHKTNWGLSDS